MTNNYTPTTEEVRERFWVNDGDWADLRDRDAFDRWLAEHDRKIQERAWQEGVRDAFRFSIENPHFTPSDLIGTKHDNPYRTTDSLARGEEHNR